MLYEDVINNTVKLFSIALCYTISLMQKRSIVGDNIRKFRTEAGITQEELALRSGLSQGYINQLEYGKRNYTQKSLERIAAALSKTVSEFFKEEGAGPLSAIAEKIPPYKAKRTYKKEFTEAIEDMPQHIIEHYLTLMRLERELLKKEGR